MLNNPYVPGDPYSYDLKWLVAKVKEILAQLGTLDEAIEAKIFEGFLEHSVVQFKTVPEMLAADIADGSIVLTLGYHEAGDSGDLFYLIKDFNPGQCSLDYFLTMDNNSQIAIPIFTTEYVTPQMFGAKANAVSFYNGVWYTSPDHTEIATNNAPFFQAAVESGYPVNVPIGKYFIAAPIEIHDNGVEISGNGMDEDQTVIYAEGTNVFTVAAGYRAVKIANICMYTHSYQGAAVEVSYTSNSSSGSCHFLTVERILAVNFKYGLMLGGKSSTGNADGQTFFWNCSFRDIKLNTFDTGSNKAIYIAHNGQTNFGMLFERVVVIGYKTDLDANAVSGKFDSCNFGINDVRAISLQTVCMIDFINCNFECDRHITGTNDVLIYTTWATLFEACSFLPNLDAGLAFMSGGVTTKITISGCKYSAKTGNVSNEFIPNTFPGGKYSINFIGSNMAIPRPTPYANRSLQLLDQENNLLPIKYATSTDDTPGTGEPQYDADPNTGNRPVWYNGSEWKGAALGSWEYKDAVTAGSSFTITLPFMNDRPRTVLLTIRGNHQDSYFVGILSKYRGGYASIVQSLTANKITVSVDGNDVLTITNTGTSTEFMYVSAIDLM